MKKRRSKRNVFLLASVLLMGVFTLVVIVLALFWVILPGIEISKLNKAFQSTSKGMTIEQVQKIMDRPKKERWEKWERDWAQWDGTLLAEDEIASIDMSLRYRAGLLVSFEFYFNGKGELIGRYRYD